MALRTLLIILGLLGGLRLGFPELQKHLSPDTSSPLIDLWTQSLGLIAIPIGLFLLSFSKSGLIRVGTLIWGLWMTGVTLCVLAWPHPMTPYLSFWGLTYILLVALNASSIAVFSIIDLGSEAKPKPVRKKKKPKEKATQKAA